LGISTLCRVLGVSRSGYYDWLRRLSGPLTGRAAQDAELLAAIQAVHERFRYYGSPRVYRELLANQHHVGRHRVARLMRANGIRACRGKIKSQPRSAPPTRRPEVADLVRRSFAAEGPNQLWFTDLTQIRTGEGWLFAAVIEDAFNREIISWATAEHDTPKTVIRALTDAIKVRRPSPGCIIHSDRGYQFTAANWLNLALGNGLQASIGERKSALDNAMMESWFASLKNEAIYPLGQPATKAEARMRLFEYIWEYNTERRHSSLGYVSPRQFMFESINCP
jgi:putative transposase